LPSPVAAHSASCDVVELSTQNTQIRFSSMAIWPTIALGPVLASSRPAIALQHYARDLSERIIPRGVETHEVVGIVLLLRDVLARSLFGKYQQDFSTLNRVLEGYEPAANRIANTVAVSFVDERERVIRQQQDAIRELSTPVLPVRERLLILPIIGVLDTERARQLTEQLLAGIRRHRAKVSSSTSPAPRPWMRQPPSIWFGRSTPRV